MIPTESSHTDPLRLAQELSAFIDESVERAGGSTHAIKPGHRVKFHWPPHPISYDYHVLASDWSGQTRFSIDEEEFEGSVARTPYGVFVRCDDLWHEDRGDTLEQAISNLQSSSEPLFRRQRAIQQTLGQLGRFKGHVRDLSPGDLLKLLYCADRDVANEARIEIETHASTHIFLPALMSVLRDERHPQRRSAQWCVLDLFEDLPSLCDNSEQEDEAVKAIRDLIWSASDDHARTIYKAGVVLGGHLPHKHGGAILLDCLKSPSKIGRRSAIHGLFHVVEWVPDTRPNIIAALRGHAETEPDTQLKEFASLMALDLERGAYDHIPEPIFPEER